MALAVHGYKRLPCKHERDMKSQIAAAVGRLREYVVCPDNTFVAFSGGKDSIVVGHMAAKFCGVTSAIMDTSFYFTKDIPDYRIAGMRLGLHVQETELLNMRFIEENPQYIFMESKLLGSYYAKRQQKAIRLFSKNTGKNYVVFGRRTEENTVHKPYYELKDGMKQIFPIYDWKNEDVWQYIVDNDIKYPKIYDTLMGKYDGAVSWPEITRERWWKELKIDPIPLIDAYEPGLIEKLALYSDVCRQYVEEKQSS